jgi:tellurite resistance-related uncharacterized protein
MQRAITGFHLDAEDDWVAELSCGHDQHVRHRPPFQVRTWVTTAEGRAGRLATPLDCPWCDRCELPDAVRRVRTSPVWESDTLPAGLRRAHRVAAGTWGRLVVERGSLTFTAATTPPVDVVVGAGEVQAIPPEVAHAVEPAGDARFRIEFLAVDRARDEGGDPACWAEAVCDECGGIDGHRPGCTGQVTGNGE